MSTSNPAYRAHRGGAPAQPRGRPARQVFSPDQYPWKIMIPKDQITDMISFMIPTEIFKAGARNWTAIRDGHAAAANTYMAGAEFIGQMLKFVPMMGTNKGSNMSYNFVRPHPYIPNMQFMTPKVYSLMSLIVKNVEDIASPGMQSTMLPEHKLLSSDNQLGIMITLISLDPNLRIIDLICAMVKENALLIPDHMAAFANEDANARTVYDIAMEAAVAAQEANGGDNEDGDGEGDGDGNDDDGDGNRHVNEGCAEDVALATGGRGGRGRGHRGGAGGRGRGNKSRPKGYSGASRADPLTLDDTELFRQMYTLRKALSVLIDATHGRQGTSEAGETRRLVCDTQMFSMRQTLENQINTERNPAVTVSIALSLENVLAKFKTLANPNATDDAIITNPQLDHTKYWTTCSFEGYPTPTECFKVPLPSFTWDFEPQHLTAHSIATMEFPWATDVLRTYASVVSSMYGLPIDISLLGIATQQITDNAVHIALRTMGINTAPPNTLGNGVVDDHPSSGDINASLLHQTDVYQRIGIVAPPTKASIRGHDALTKGRDAPTAATAKLWSLLMNDDSSGVCTMRTELRGVGKITQAALSYVRLLAAAMTRVLRDLGIPTGLRPTAATTKTQQHHKKPSPPPTPLNMGSLEEQLRQPIEPSHQSSRLEEDEEEADDNDDDEAADEELAEMRASEFGNNQRPVDCQSIRRKAVSEIRAVALKEFAAMIDPAAARIQPALREVARMIRSGCSIELPFTIHSPGSGVFSNMISEITLLFKYLRIATNNVPLMLLMIARDTTQMSPLLGTLSMHPYVSSAYAGGKSMMWEMLEKISVRWHIEYIMGSSPKGILPVYSDPNEAPADGTVYAYDELPTFVTTSSAKLSADAKDIQSIMSSVMTSSRRPTMYRTVRKVGDGVQAAQICVDASFSMAGNTNIMAPRDSVIVARMVPITAAQSSVGASRNAVNFMVAHSMGKISDTLVAERLKRLDILGMLAFNAMYTGAIPIPNMDLLTAHITTLIEHLQHDRPEIIQAIRILEIAQTMAGVCAVWTALATVFSGQFGEAREILERKGGAISPEDIALITPYLQVNYEIVYFVLAYAIYSATNPISYKILRWMGEKIGNYSFVKYTKSKDRAYSHGGLPVTTAKDQTADQRQAAQTEGDVHILTEEQIIDAELAENSLFSTENEMPELTWLANFGDWYFDTCPAPSIVSMDPASKQSDNAKHRQNNTKRGAHAQSKHVGPPETVEDFYEMEGATVQLPLSDSSNARKKSRLMDESRAILAGTLCPEDYAEYKRTPVGKQLHIDPNYILVRGSRDYFATWFSQQNQHLKLSRDNIITEFDRMLVGNTLITAHLLPLIRQSGEVSRTVDVLTTVERYRVELMHDPRCLRRRVPIILPSSQGVYILIEALLDSPKNLVYRNLDYLGCEGTPNIKMAMPMARTRATAHLLREYSARKVEGRVLMYSNPLHTPEAERPFLDKAILDALDLRTHADAMLVWNKDSELNSIRDFFDEHGIDAKPEHYTCEAIHKRIVIPNAAAAADDMISEVSKAVLLFDRNAKDQQHRCNANYTNVRVNTSAIEAAAIQQQITTNLRIPKRQSRSGAPGLMTTDAHDEGRLQPPTKMQCRQDLRPIATTQLQQQNRNATVPAVFL